MADTSGEEASAARAESVKRQLADSKSEKDGWLGRPGGFSM